MRVTFADIEAAAARKSGLPEAGWACAWLTACGYKGIEMLLEALADPVRDAPLEVTVLGVDGAGVSAVYIAPRLFDLAARHGRIVYRNSRHGLYVLPFAVRGGLAIGCPVDPAFHIGGERSGNPYAEKLEAARRSGIVVDGELWAALAS